VQQWYWEIRLQKHDERITIAIAEDRIVLGIIF
jgi:hypothetical protein